MARLVLEIPDELLEKLELGGDRSWVHPNFEENQEFDALGQSLGRRSEVFEVRDSRFEVEKSAKRCEVRSNLCKNGMLPRSFNFQGRNQ